MKGIVRNFERSPNPCLNTLAAEYAWVFMARNLPDGSRFPEKRFLPCPIERAILWPGNSQCQGRLPRSDSCLLEQQLQWKKAAFHVARGLSVWAGY